MRKVFLRIGSLLAMIAVILGAFGAHALKEMIPAAQLITFETGVRYQFYHAFAILLVDLLIHFRKTNTLVVAGWLFTAGVVFFSGSLYALSLQSMMSSSVSFLGPITPLGGLLFILGWGALFLSGFSHTNKLKVSSKEKESSL
jgi:uncharacterized membrane protein YgdD (TMEM256/DUF423 family)